MNWTVRTPAPSSAFRTQPSVAMPGPSGEKVTNSVSVVPGASVMPSGNWVMALNAPMAGGLDLVTVSVVPPVLATVKLAVALPPTATAPRSSDSGVTVRTPGAEQAPDSCTTFGPTLVSKLIDDV